MAHSASLDVAQSNGLELKMMDIRKTSAPGMQEKIGWNECPPKVQSRN